MKPKQLTDERGTTHGSFEENARISQSLKGIMCSTKIGQYNDVQREAIDMICLKLSRIASGHANFKDHWDDISGYAHLAAKELDDSVE
jgi:hypothetical protein